MSILQQKQEHYQHQHQPVERLPLALRRAANLPAWFWQSFLGFWHTPMGEPRVHQVTDRDGQLYWWVYDPLNDNTIRFDDEQKLLIWLDEQHHRRARPRPWNID